jgi:hypothetical protein
VSVTTQGEWELRGVKATYVPLDDVVRLAVDWVTDGDLHLLMVDVKVDQALELLGELGDAVALAEADAAELRNDRPPWPEPWVEDE